MHNFKSLPLVLLVSIGVLAQEPCEPIQEVNFPGGRVVLSFDGNVHDDDDIVALPLAGGLWWAAGLKDKVVQIEYNNHVCNIDAVETDGNANFKGDDSQHMRESAQGLVTHFGYNPGILYDYETQGSNSTSNMADEIEKSTASDPLWIIAGGPMETVWRALNEANSGHDNVVVISHSNWNETHTECSNAHDWNDLKNDFESQGVFFVGHCSGSDCNNTDGLNDQNGGFAGDFNEWDWLENSSEAYNQWIYSRNPFHAKFDPSDAGMSYYLITGGPFNGGDKTGDHNDARHLMENPCGSTGQEKGGEGCETDFEEDGGLVVMEAENLSFVAGWSVNSSASGHSGGGYLEWEGGDSFNTPGNGTISTSIKINQPGTYLFKWRNKIGHGNNITESNDTWLRFPDADDFFGMKSNGSIIYPKGSGKTPNPNGASSDNWFKVYVNSLSWGWSTYTSDHDGHEIYVTFNSAGVYHMEISGRSNHHLIDRIVLSKDGIDGSSLSLNETFCDEPSSGDIAVESVEVTPATVNLAVGQSIDLDYTILPADATNKSIGWSTTNPAVATINSIGRVSAISPGTAVITVTTVDGGHTSSSIITVSSDEEPDPDPDPDPEPEPEPEPETELPPSISIDDASAMEGEGLDFVLSLDKPGDVQITVDLLYLNESATESDYWTETESVTFEPGETEKVVHVPTYNDELMEEDETFIVAVAEVMSGKLHNFTDMGVGTILDEDSEMVISPNPARANSSVQISGMLQGDYFFELYSMTGELLGKKQVTVDAQHEYHVANLAKGIYVIRAANPDKEYAGKLIVQ